MPRFDASVDGPQGTFEGSAGDFRPGGPGAPAPPESDAPPPVVRNLMLRNLGNHLVEISWKTDPGYRDNLPRYSVRFTSETLAGSSVGDSTWAEKVSNQSEEIASRNYTRGGAYSVIYNGSQSPDGWIVVQTIRANVVLAHSNPVRAIFSSANTLLPANITGQIFAISANSLLYRGAYINSLQMAFAWVAPSDTTNFDGVAIHIVGLNGGTAPVELSAFQTWDQTRTTYSPIIALPLESGRANGVATFTNGSAAIVRVSGTAFIAGDVGHRMVVFDQLNGSVREGYNNVATFTDGSHITQAATFSGTTGNYLFRILDPMTAYFVAVSKYGIRAPSYATAPSASV